MISKRKLIFRIILISTLVFVVFSCLLPSNKTQYIRKYERFVDQVKKDHSEYSKKEWRWADKRYKKFSKDWYKLYEDELTTGEKLKVAALSVRYQSYKGKKELGKVKKLLKKDVDDMKKKAEEYIENDAREDLEKLREGAKEIGDSAVKVLEDIIDSVEKKLN